MSGAEQRLVTEPSVRALARLAVLEVPEGREAALADELNALLTDAARVNQFMAQRPEVAPATGFTPSLQVGGGRR